MINVIRDGNVVKIHIDTDLPNASGGTVYYPFEYTCSSPASAELLYRYMREWINGAIERSHKRAYEQGWTDHRQKARKKDTFSTILDSNTIGW
jgi:hypothetical protein